MVLACVYAVAGSSEGGEDFYWSNFLRFFWVTWCGLGTLCARGWLARGVVGDVGLRSRFRLGRVMGGRINLFTRSSSLEGLFRDSTSFLFYVAEVAQCNPPRRYCGAYVLVRCTR